MAMVITSETMFVEGWNFVQQIVHRTAEEKGWWKNDLKDLAAKITETWDTDLIDGSTDLGKLLSMIKNLPDREIGTLIALQHSELSEGLEYVRMGNPQDDKIPEFTGLEAEFADVVIRIMDVAHHNKLNVVGAILAKVAMNKTRAYKHGGKEF